MLIGWHPGNIFFFGTLKQWKHFQDMSIQTETSQPSFSFLLLCSLYCPISLYYLRTFSCLLCHNFFLIQQSLFRWFHLVWNYREQHSMDFKSIFSMIFFLVFVLPKLFKKSPQELCTAHLNYATTRIMHTWIIPLEYWIMQTWIMPCFFF